MTLISRVLGLIRDVVVAQVLGAGVVADVFLFANKIPNFLRRLFAEGAFAQAFIPVLNEVHNRDELEHSQNQQTRALIAQVSGTLGVIVTLVTLIGMLASPILVIIFGGGWFVDWLQGDTDQGKFELAGLFLKITFPYLWFISFTALAGAVLNTLGRFAASSFTPVLLNVCIIVMAIFGADYFSNPGYALAWGVFLGGLVQFLFQLPFLAKAGFLVKPQWAWHAPGVAKIRRLIVPALFGVSVTQINLLLDTQIATFLQTGSVSWLYFADRLLEFPLGLFGIGIATVILPSLSRLHAKQNSDEFSATLDWGIRVVSLFGWPALAGLMVLAQPIIMVLFMRGAFSQTDVLQVSLALYAYLSGLISFMFIKILAPGYYARQDTKTPVRIGIKAMLANMIFNLSLAPFFGYVGLAIATTLSACLNAYWLYQGLQRQHVFNISAATGYLVIKLVLAVVAMVLVLLQLSPSFEWWLSIGTADKIQRLILCIFAGGLTYLLAIAALGVRIRDFKVQNA
jgi:putative peptidoglycan lipid II flippase